MKAYLQDTVLQIVSDIVTQQNQQAYVIGGYVRDIFLKRPNKDIDIVTLGDGIELAEQTANRISPNITVSVFKNFGTAMFKYRDCEYEFVGARRESYTHNSRKPTVESGSLRDDQNRRDFTINALAISLHSQTFGELLDPFNGVEDINKKIIRTPLNPDITFSDDPLRMMRAVRFATQLGFRIESETYNALQRNKSRLAIVSKERIIDEFNKIMSSAKPSIGIVLLESSGLLQEFFPELQALKGVEYVGGHTHKDNFFHTLEVLDAVCAKSNNMWLRWAALLHDIAKPRTKKYIEGTGWTFHGHEFMGAKMIPEIFKKLKLPLHEPMKYVQKLVSLHLRPIALVDSHITDSAIRRLLFDAGNDIDDLMLLCHADITSKNEQKVKTLHANFEHVVRKLKQVEEKDAIRNWQPPISGELIIETFGIKPSREVGIIKDAIREAILDGEIENTYDSAYSYMLEQGIKLGLQVTKK